MIPVCGPLTLAVFFALSIEAPLFVSLIDMRARTPTESALGGTARQELRAENRTRALSADRTDPRTIHQASAHALTRMTCPGTDVTPDTVPATPTE